MLFSIKYFLIFFLAAPILVPILATSLSYGGHLYDLVTLFVSVNVFILDLFTDGLTFLRDGLLTLQHGSTNIPGFDFLSGALQAGGMEKVELGKELPQYGNTISDMVCMVGLKIITAIHGVTVYVADSIRDGQLATMMHEGFAWLDKKMVNYDFYAVGRTLVESFVDSVK